MEWNVWRDRDRYLHIQRERERVIVFSHCPDLFFFTCNLEAIVPTWQGAPAYLNCAAAFYLEHLFVVGHLVNHWHITYWKGNSHERKARSLCWYLLIDHMYWMLFVGCFCFCCCCCCCCCLLLFTVVWCFFKFIVSPIKCPHLGPSKGGGAPYLEHCVDSAAALDFTTRCWRQLQSMPTARHMVYDVSWRFQGLTMSWKDVEVLVLKDAGINFDLRAKLWV